MFFIGLIIGIIITTVFFFSIMIHIYKTHLIGSINLGYEAIRDGQINMRIANMPESRSGDFVILKCEPQKNFAP